MNFLLKIVEGPNKGAEVALVSGVAVTLGKGDDCDIVLADTTLPSTPITLEASEDGVTVDGEPLELFAVKTLGATSFAAGPADAQWSELKWPEKDEGPKDESKKPEAEKGNAATDGSETKAGRRAADDASRASSPVSKEGESADNTGGKKRRSAGCGGCLVAVVLLILALACLAWFYRAAIADFCETKGYDISRFTLPFGSSVKPLAVEAPTLASVAARYGLSLEESDGQVRLVGNLKTRGERLRATAEAYEARPGVELDLSDDESFRTSADDALFTLTEGALKVVSATNRVLSISGVARSPEALRRVLVALDADLPKLRGVDAAGVAFGAVAKNNATVADGREETANGMPRLSRSVSKRPASTSLPVCGILTKPYPCLVMRDGTRVLEGAPLGEGIILKIDADAVTITNSMGRFTWKP